MRLKTSTTAKKLFNLYRQHHVIYGGWASINPIFVEEADDNILHELELLPTGKRLVQHIKNLRSGATPLDSINKKLLPYGRLMIDDISHKKLDETEISNIKSALKSFTPDKEGLQKIKSLSVIQNFGNEWLTGIRSAVGNDQDALKTLAIVRKTDRAYYLWALAKDILKSPISDRTRALIQSELPEFESYLPMFGKSGEDTLIKLRDFISNN